jgi:hypothetical protein
MRLGRFAFFLVIYCYLAWRASEILGIPLDAVSFGVGIAAAGLTGVTLFLINNWWHAITQPYRPQAVRLETRETPSQITCAAFLALLIGIFVIVGLVVAVIFGLPYLLP